MQHCARNHELLKVLSLWVQPAAASDSGETTASTVTGATFYPVCNRDTTLANSEAKLDGLGRLGRSALHEAMESHSWEAVVVLANNLSLTLGPTHARVLTDAVGFMAMTMPEHMCELLNILEPRLLQKQDLQTEHLARDDVVSSGWTVRVEMVRSSRSLTHVCT